MAVPSVTWTVWETEGPHFLKGDDFLVGVDQVVVVSHPEDSFIGGLDLEVAVPGGCFRVLDVQGTQARLPEIGLQDLLSLAVVDPTELEALAEL